MEPVKMSVLQKQIVALVRAIRDENQSCTMREVARRAQMNASYISAQIGTLIQLGVLGATDLPGSLHVVADLAVDAEPGPSPEPSQTRAPIPAKVAADAAKKVTPKS